MESKIRTHPLNRPVLDLNLQHRPDIGVLTNRVNYIIRKQEKSKINLNNTL